MHLIYSFHQYHLYKFVYCNLHYIGDKVNVRIFDKNPYLEKDIVKESLRLNKTLQPLDLAKSYLSRVIRVTDGLNEYFAL